MAAAVEPSAPQDPRFISKLFTLKRYNCYFVVGNKEQTEPERIGVVFEMLMVHSEVLESEMLVREVEEKKCIEISDIQPGTFKNLLKYVYGYDNTDSLCFDEADNLLYAAEKYMIEPLKARLATRLSTLLSPDNICSLLNNPACYRVLELDSAITKVLQTQTDKVLASPMFLDLSPDHLNKVFEQEAMNVPEIEVWRAAVKWAKHRTNSDNGQDLRRALEGPAQHIRVCAVDDDSFVDEVYPSGILTEEEFKIVTICKLKNKKKVDSPIGFSNKLHIRTTNSFCKSIVFDKINAAFLYTKGQLDIVTDDSPIELLPLRFIGSRGQGVCPRDATYTCKCTITIALITDYFTTSSSETPLSIELTQEVGFGGLFSVPVAIGGRNIVLQAMSKYRMNLTFNKPLVMYRCCKSSTACEHDHLCKSDDLVIEFNTVNGFNTTPFRTLYYRVAQL